MTAKKEDASPPLHAACRSPDAKALRELLESGKFDVNEPAGPFSWAPLHDAAGNGHLACMEALLEAGARVNAEASDLETPLHIAAQQAQPEAVKFLAERGAKIDAMNEDGESPLLVAVQHIGGKGAEHIEMLLQLRADPTSRSAAGHDAVACARLYTNRGDELEALLSRFVGAGGGSSSAAGAGDDSSASLADRRQRAFKEATGGTEFVQQAIHKACREGKEDLLKELLAWSPDGAASTAQSSLAWAAESGHVGVVESLLAARANIHAECGWQGDHLTTRALVAASGEGQVRMVRWLLGHRCDPRAAAADGATPLMSAAVKGSDEACSLLLSARAAVDMNHFTDQEGKEGWTALMLASQAGHASVARRLLDARADMEQRSSELGSARDLALSNGHQDVVKVLDQRAKLTGRQKSRASNRDEAPSGGASEDTRDLDALLRALGEGGGGGGAKSGKAGKKAGKSAKPPAASAAVELKSAPGVGAPSAGAAPGAVASGRGGPSSSGAQLPKAAAEEAEEEEEEEEEHGDDEGGEEARVRRRLQEIEDTRAKLDAEELQLRRRLDKLRPSSGGGGGRGGSGRRRK